MYQIRTDLALETQEKMQEDHVELKGVRFLVVIVFVYCYSLSIH